MARHVPGAVPVLREVCRLPVSGKPTSTREPWRTCLSSAKMLSYEKQLELKRDTVVQAYKNYSGACRTAILSPEHGRTRFS